MLHQRCLASRRTLIDSALCFVYVPAIMTKLRPCWGACKWFHSPCRVHANVRKHPDWPCMHLVFNSFYERWTCPRFCLLWGCNMWPITTQCSRFKALSILLCSPANSVFYIADCVNSGVGSMLKTMPRRYTWQRQPRTASSSRAWAKRWRRLCRRSPLPWRTTQMASFPLLASTDVDYITIHHTHTYTAAAALWKIGKSEATYWVRAAVNCHSNMCAVELSTESCLLRSSLAHC